MVILLIGTVLFGLLKPPGDGYKCKIDPKNPKCLMVIGSYGEVIFEATPYATLQEIFDILNAAGAKIEMHISIF